MWVGSSEGGETEDIAKVGKESYENKHTPREGGSILREKAHEQKAIMSKVCSMKAGRQRCLKERVREIRTEPSAVEKERPIAFI